MKKQGSHGGASKAPSSRQCVQITGPCGQHHPPIPPYRTCLSGQESFTSGLWDLPVSCSTEGMCRRLTEAGDITQDPTEDLFLPHLQALPRQGPLCSPQALRLPPKACCTQRGPILEQAGLWPTAESPGQRGQDRRQGCHPTAAQRALGDSLSQPSCLQVTRRRTSGTPQACPFTGTQASWPAASRTRWVIPSATPSFSL